MLQNLFVLILFFKRLVLFHSNFHIDKLDFKAKTFEQNFTWRK